MDLNSRQREAVRYLDGPLLVLAGAGSGKTRVITTKIAYLIQECGINARQIVAVTFTNKAAREMKERIARQLGGKEIRGLHVSTFHTLGLTIIKKELKTLGYKPGFSIFDAEDSLALLKELMRIDHPNDDGGVAQQIQWQISRWKGELISDEQALRHSAAAAEYTAALLYAKYQRHLRSYNAVDFDDLIFQPAQLLRGHPEILNRWQDRIYHLLVDEYQDTNFSQYSLVKMLGWVMMTSRSMRGVAPVPKTCSS
ncbi:MAG: ATP-dependent DNA helicase Rep [Halothiobacillaceae bacterium]|nr:MAG: ATP-dependent DNA helicase Rep [Halothiobacillaceae bacterium]